MSSLGIKASGLSVISKLLPTDVLSLSYPDLVCTAEEVETITGFKPIKFSDSNKWHNKDYQLPETLHVLEGLGATLRCVDIVASREVEEVFDLNYPQTFGQYGLVLDCGTTEHCFNVSQALLNAANAVREGGYIFHTPPLNMMNHGFYNLNPTLFYDFYMQNEWELLLLAGEVNNKWFEISPAKREVAPVESSLMILAKRTHSRPLKYPMQSKYLHNPMLK